MCPVYCNRNCVTSFVILQDLVCHETPTPPPCNCPLACLSTRSAVNKILEAKANHVSLTENRNRQTPSLGTLCHNQMEDKANTKD